MAFFFVVPFEIVWYFLFFKVFFILKIIKLIFFICFLIVFYTTLLKTCKKIMMDAIMILESQH
jgi:hypothetical protein